jgi:hypothetical protein
MLCEADGAEIARRNLSPPIFCRTSQSGTELDVFLAVKPREKRRASILKEHDSVLTGAADFSPVEDDPSTGRPLEACQDV